MEIITERTKNGNAKQSDSITSAFVHLQKILLDYLESRPNLSLNGLAKRCAVSEPSLRRIKKGQLKTLPEITTIADLLCYISQEPDARKIADHFPGPIADHLHACAYQLDALVEIEVSQSLTQMLKDPVKYLVYKLSVNSEGVSMDKVVELFGSYGEKQIIALVQDDLVEEKNNRYFGKIQYFALANDVFVEHFKSTADFIKPHKHANAARSHSPLFVNYSTGLSKKAYNEILRIQRSALKKVLKVITDKNSAGHIPTFYLAALDTIDQKSADEFPND